MHALQQRQPQTEQHGRARFQQRRITAESDLLPNEVSVRVAIALPAPPAGPDPVAALGRISFTVLIDDNTPRSSYCIARRACSTGVASDTTTNEPLANDGWQCCGVDRSLNVAGNLNAHAEGLVGGAAADTAATVGGSVPAVARRNGGAENRRLPQGAYVISETFPLWGAGGEPSAEYAVFVIAPPAATPVPTSLGGGGPTDSSPGEEGSRLDSAASGSDSDFIETHWWWMFVILPGLTILVFAAVAIRSKRQRLRAQRVAAWQQEKQEQQEQQEQEETGKEMHMILDDDDDADDANNDGVHRGARDRNTLLADCSRRNEGQGQSESGGEGDRRRDHGHHHTRRHRARYAHQHNQDSQNNQINQHQHRKGTTGPVPRLVVSAGVPESALALAIATAAGLVPRPNRSSLGERRMSHPSSSYSYHSSDDDDESSDSRGRRRGSYRRRYFERDSDDNNTCLRRQRPTDEDDAPVGLETVGSNAHGTRSQLSSVSSSDRVSRDGIPGVRAQSVSTSAGSEESHNRTRRQATVDDVDIDLGYAALAARLQGSLLALGGSRPANGHASPGATVSNK
jgi:hypothetical protein